MKNTNKDIKKLKKRLQFIDTLKSMRRWSPEFKKWRRDTEVTIENIFGSKTRHIKDFTKVWQKRPASSDMPDSEFEKQYQNALEDARSVLLSFIEGIEEWGIKNQTIIKGNEHRLKQKIDERQKNWDLLGQQLSKLEKEKILETRVEERERLEHRIGTLKNERQKVEEELNKLEAQLPS